VIIRVLIADDHGVLAEGLRSLIEAQAGLEVVALARDGRDAVRRALAMQPDIVVMDNAMPVLNGTEAARMIRARSPRILVVMLSMYSDSVHVQRAFQAGAGGYVLKASAANEVVRAIRTVHGGRRYLSAPLADALLERMASEHAEDPLSRLSARERQVLQMIAEGRSIVAIAGVLSLSRKTVETYRARMMAKLDLGDLAALVKFAIRHGVVPLD
jgi:DNA-binding NarL/FixJ family response regulator